MKDFLQLFLHIKHRRDILTLKHSNTFFLLWNINEDILRNVSFFVSGSQWQQNSLVSNILQNIFFCVPHKKVLHTGLGRHEGEHMLSIFILGEQSKWVK